jgi:hypothetical protein
MHITQWAETELLLKPSQDDTLNIVLEYAPHGDLSNLIQERAAAQKPFTEDEIMFWSVPGAEPHTCCCIGNNHCMHKAVAPLHVYAAREH